MDDSMLGHIHGSPLEWGSRVFRRWGGKQSKFQWHEKEQDDSAMGGNDSLMSRDIHDSRGHVRAQARGKVVEPRHGERGLAMAVFNKRVVPWR